MYIITRSDLSNGMQLAQTAHVAMAWKEDHGIEDDTVIVLCVDSETALSRLLLELLSAYGVVSSGISWFQEPDLCGALTAIAIGEDAKRSLRNLPLAGP